MKNILLFLLLLIPGFLFSQELPPINFYSTDLYQAENQNWSISQAPNKNIYFANNGGLLEFNGARWKLYDSPNETIIRSVKVVNERIYTGSYMDFGFWKKNVFGLLEYTSLTKKLSIKLIEDEQFWNIIQVDQWTLFQSLNRIYILNNTDDSLDIIESETTITKMYTVNETIYYQEWGKGIFKIENGKSRLITDDKTITNSIVNNIFSDNDGLLFLTDNKGFFKLEGSKFTPWNFVQKDILSNVNIYNSIQLSDGSFALGTISDGIIYISNQGEVIYQINQQNGLGNNTILSLFEDVDKNIWLGLDNGISYLELNSAFKIYRDNSGELGSIYTIHIKNNYLYLGTNQGLYYRKVNSASKFKLIEGTEGQVWILTKINDELFCGHNKGTFLINTNKAQLISDIQGTWNIKKINGRENMLLQGNYNGLNVLEKKNGLWEFKNKIKGFDNSSRFFEFTSNNEIVVNHEYKGIYKIKIDTTFTNALKITRDSIIKGHNSSLLKYNNEIIYSYKKGIFKYHSKEKRFVKDTLLSEFFKNDDFISGKLVYDPVHKSLWNFSKSSLNYITPGNLSDIPDFKSIDINALSRNGVRSYESIVWFRDNKYILGTSSGYIIIDLDKFASASNELFINSIAVNELNKNQKLIDKNKKGLFSYDENNILFSYNVNNYDKFIETNYQYQLEGLYDSWTDWTTNSSVQFKNLPFGDYIFKIRAKVGNNVLKSEVFYNFKIKRPWYLSNYAIVYYLFCLILFSFIMHTSYKKYYKKQREKLLQKAKQKLELKSFENKQQKLSFKNKSLKQDIENKNRELALSTMSLIKKNEFLGQIKNELKKTPVNENISSVVKTIDDNINSSDDWKMFEKAFNNADKKFFKKVKKHHPELTSNDLRLCMFLRMNLNSKDIAPLLNISPRSVEIKRYRLRKKLQLEREINLNEYFINLN